MSRHQAVRNLDYEEVLDEYDADYADIDDEGDQLTAEDREALRKGTEDVRDVLGVDATKVSTEQIQEALWHYYYDVDKTVAYLRRKFIAPPPKAEPKNPKESKSLSVFSLVHSPSAARGAERAHVERSADGKVHGTGSFNKFIFPATSLLEEALPPSWYFKDIPWSNVPKHREAIFIPPVPPLPGGLLGGSDPPKVSKLQALAAARKKKSEAKKNQGELEERAQKRLSTLTINDDSVSKQSADPPTVFKRQKTFSGSSNSKMPPMSFAQRKKELAEEASARPEEMKNDDMSMDTDDPRDDRRQAYETEDSVLTDPSKPSAFAQVLCGLSASPTSAPARTYELPGTSSPLFNPAAFEQPSPDDIVLAAQAKGSRFAKS